MEKILLILCLSALSYVISAFVIAPPWGEILQNTLKPSFQTDSTYILAVLATIGTTITPWGIFYMQASVVDKGVDAKDFHLTRIDVVSGAVWGNVISAFIVITTAATLFIYGITVDSAEEAAQALLPIAGQGAKYLFSAGLLGASLLAASVLPLSTTYAVCEAFGWERGLNQRRSDAPIFFGLYAAMIAISVVVVLIPSIPLFSIMVLSQSLNAILLPILLVLVIKLANDKRLMGEWANGKLQNILSISLTGLISLVTVALLFFSVFNRFI